MPDVFHVLVVDDDTDVRGLLAAVLENDGTAKVTEAASGAEAMSMLGRDEFDVAYKEGTLVMLTFHPHVSGHRSRIVQMEKLFEYIKAKPGVWFGTAEQVARYVKPSAGKTH